MTKIVALWAVPRSTSTAFEWMMRQRGDMDCLHEPFGEAWYQGEAPLWPRYRDGDKRTAGLTLDTVWADLQARAELGPVFVKDFPHYIDHFWNEDFLRRFTHSFLIREPALTISSMYDKWPDFHEKEVGFPEQRALFDLITEMDGSPPPVIDSNDLLEDPVRTTRIWCEAVGLPFIESALSWAPGPRDEVSWWDGGVFHANLRASDGLKPQPRRYIEMAEAPARVQEVCARMKPHYDWLRAHRLGA